MESLFESLIAQGVGELWLEVRLENKEAIGLYGGLGFREVSVIPNYYSDGSDALRMRKAFAPKLVGGQGV
jgi:ribosomal protein S18 acetylase RimI-like enzyme